MNDIAAIVRFPAEPPRPASTVPAPTGTESAPTTTSAASSSGARIDPPSAGAEMRFELDRDHSRVVLRMTDPSTGEIVRQIPSEVLLRVAAMITEARGGTVDATV